MDNTNDIQYKQYRNEKLLALIKSKIPQDKYGDFTELVYEIILRRAYTFDLTEETISQEIDTLLANCETIQFSTNFEKDTTMGHVILSKKLLEINSKYFEKKPDFENMYENLTHEVYHAMSAHKTDKNKTYTGLQFFDENGNKCGRALNEAFNEYAADMASCSVNQVTEEKYYRITYEYSDITFIVPLLAAAIGVTEKEIVKHGITSRDDLMEFMLSKIPEAKRADFQTDFKKFEVQLEILKEVSLKKKSELTEDDKKNAENAYGKIAYFAYNTFEASITNDKRPLTKELQEEYEFRNNALRAILFRKRRYLTHLMLPDAISRVHDVLYAKQGRINVMISALNHVTRISDYVSETERDTLVDMIKKFYPQKKDSIVKQYEEEMFRNKGIENVKTLANTRVTNLDQTDYPTDVSQNAYRRMIRKENYDDFKQWDNSDEVQKLKELFEKWHSQEVELKQPNENDLSKNPTTSQPESPNPNPSDGVTPKQIGICDQAESITTEEIDTVQSTFKNMMVEMQHKQDSGLKQTD